MVSQSHDIPTATAGIAGPPEGWGWVLACGLLLLVAGLCALAAPGLTTVVVSTIVGWLLVIAGVAGIVLGIRTRAAHRRQIDLLYGAVSLVAGVAALWNPIAGAATLTLVVAVWLGVRGAIELGAARRAIGAGRSLLLLAGVVNIALALLLVVNFPFPAVQVIGVFVGLSFLFAGAATVLAATQLRRLAHP